MARRRGVEGKLAPALAIALGACGAHGAGLGMPGASDRAAEAPRHPAASTSASLEPWSLSPEVPTYPAIDDRALPSGHNAPYWSGVVRANPTLDSLYRTLAPQTAVPIGAVVVEQHRAQDGAPGPQYAMVKRESGFDPTGGDWEYLIVDDAGNVASRGALPYCVRCHGDAAADHLFGPRVATRRRLAGAAEGDPATHALPDDDEARAPDADTPGAPGQKPTKPRKKKRLAAHRRTSIATNPRIATNRCAGGHGSPRRTGGLCASEAHARTYRARLTREASPHRPVQVSTWTKQNTDGAPARRLGRAANDAKRQTSKSQTSQGAIGRRNVQTKQRSLRSPRNRRGRKLVS